MSKCDMTPPDCDSPGCKCPKKKKQIEDCCPKPCRCMSSKEYDDLTKQKRFKNLGDDNRKRLNNRGFVGALHKKQYTKARSGCPQGANREKCQLKSKCLLRSYNDTKKKSEETNPCCPGQTGHHIIPGVTLGSNASVCYNDDDHNQAPTVCVAGAGQTLGTHGVMHRNTQKTFGDLCKKINGRKASYKEIRKASLKAFEKSFKNSECDMDCMAKQLDDAYKELDKDKRRDRSRGGSCDELKRSSYECTVSGGGPASPDTINHVDAIAKTQAAFKGF